MWQYPESSLLGNNSVSSLYCAKQQWWYLACAWCLQVAFLCFFLTVNRPNEFGDGRLFSGRDPLGGGKGTRTSLDDHRLPIRAHFSKTSILSQMLCLIHQSLIAAAAWQPNRRPGTETCQVTLAPSMHQHFCRSLAFFWRPWYCKYLIPEWNLLIRQLSYRLCKLGRADCLGTQWRHGQLCLCTLLFQPKCSMCLFRCMPLPLSPRLFVLTALEYSVLRAGVQHLFRLRLVPICRKAQSIYLAVLRRCFFFILLIYEW